MYKPQKGTTIEPMGIRSRLKKCAVRETEAGELS